MENIQIFQLAYKLLNEYATHLKSDGTCTSVALRATGAIYHATVEHKRGVFKELILEAEVDLIWFDGVHQTSHIGIVLDDTLSSDLKFFEHAIMGEYGIEKFTKSDVSAKAYVDSLYMNQYEVLKGFRSLSTN